MWRRANGYHKAKTRQRCRAFTAEAPDAKPAPKLRGKRQPLALALPPELLRTIDRFAAQERRSRANMIEIILDDYAQARLAKDAA